MPVSTPDVLSIFEVSDPGLNLHSVMVRVATDFATKFPNKPWGTPLSKVVVKKESDKFPGYVLVDFEPVQGSTDLFWIFQSLANARDWTTKSKSRDNLTPTKFRGQIVRVTTETDVVPETEPDSLTDTLVSSVVKQQKDTGKAIRENTTEVIDENVAPLVGQQFAPGGVLLATSEALVVEGTDTDKAFLVNESGVDPLGNGKAVKQSSKAKRRTTTNTTEDGWPLKQVKTKGTDNLVPPKFKILTTTEVTAEQVELVHGAVNDIPEPDTPTGDQAKIEHEKINDYRYERRTTREIIDAGGTPLVGFKLTGDGQIATVTESLIITGGDDDTVSGSATTIEASTDPLGNGQSVKTVVTIPALLAKYQYGASNNPAIAPDKFRTNPGEVTVSYTATGSATQPTLTGTYSSKSEKQIDEFTKQVSHSQILSNTTGVVKGTSVDPRTGEVFADDQELVPAAAVTVTGGVDASGNVVLYDGIDANWSTKTTRKIASTTSQTYQEVVKNIEWPAVLLGITFKTWEAKSGESVIYAIPRFRRGFNGPQVATVTKYWSKANPGEVAAVSMVEEGFHYQCPLFTVRVDPCLHQAITITCNIGTSDPDWESATDSETFAATNLTDWPDSLFWRECQPYAGGYMVTEYTVPKPA